VGVGQEEPLGSLVCVKLSFEDPTQDTATTTREETQSLLERLRDRNKKAQAEEAARRGIDTHTHT
jgi:hypothetical protein